MQQRPPRREAPPIGRRNRVFGWIACGGIGLLIVFGLLIWAGGGESPDRTGGSAAEWWYNHQERMPPEAECDSDIDFVIKLPGSWAIDEMDCEEVVVRRRDNKALATIHANYDGKGNIDAKMDRFLLYFKSGKGATTAGAASNSGPVLAYRTESQTPAGLAYSYDSDWIGWLGGCEGDVEVREWAIGRDIDQAEYRLHIGASVCDGYLEAERERNDILGSVRFPGAN